MTRGFLALPLLAFLLSCNSTTAHKSPLFEDVAKQTGIDFWQYSGATGEMLLPEMVGSGAALIDYDNDGDMDVFLIQGYPTDSARQTARAAARRLEAGQSPLPEQSESGRQAHLHRCHRIAGLAHADKGMGVAAGDYDNDGYTDLYVTNYDHNILYHNNGNGTFTDVTAAAGSRILGLVHQRRIYRL